MSEKVPEWMAQFRIGSARGIIAEHIDPVVTRDVVTLPMVRKWDYDRLAEINKVLVEALGKYGRHEKLCAEIGGYGYCSCGLEKAIAKAKEMGNE